MKDFMRFNTFATSTIVMAIFWMVLLASIALVPTVFILGLIFKGLWAAMGYTMVALIHGAFVVSISRIVCEGVILRFKIHEELKKLNK